VLPVIFLTILVDLLGFGIVLPVIPQLLGNPESPYFLLSDASMIGTGYILLGFLTASFPLAQFFAAPILGQLSDTFGRKPVLAISLTGTCASYVLFAIGILTQNLPLLFISRVFDGITGGNISVAQAAIADITQPKDRAKNFGLIGAAFGIGLIIGPFLGGKLSDPSILPWFDATTPFWFAAILSALNVISILFFFPETHRTRMREKVIQWKQSIQNIIRAYSLVHLRTVFTAAFLYQAGFSFFVSFFSVYLISRFGFTESNIGDFFAYLGIWIAFTQAVVTRYVAQRFPEHKVIAVTFATTGSLLFVYLLPHYWWQLLFVVPFFAISNGLTQAMLPSLVSKQASKDEQGEVLGINASIQALAQAIPPILSGWIAALLTPESPIIFAGLIILSGAVYFKLMYHPKES
jgi:DHA1 family tetracycline resistance protein-like MFS transporter